MNVRPVFQNPPLENGMKKLKLNVEALAVESFDTTRAGRQTGTVVGEQCTCYTVCTCPGQNTCDNTCAATCVCVSDFQCGNGGYSRVNDTCICHIT